MQLPHSTFSPEKLRQQIEEARINAGVYGLAIAVLHKDELIFAEGFGKRNDEDPFTIHTASQIASVTKSFTAAAVGELVAEGKLDWDKTPVSEYVPEFQLKDPVLTSQLTLVDLLSHRTPIPSRNIAWTRNRDPCKDLIHRLRHLDMPSKLPRECNYNNAMYVVAGEAAANVSGIPFEDVVRTKIIEPLGLNNTGFTPTEMRESNNYALPYAAATFEDALSGKFVKGNMGWLYDGRAASGGIYSDVLDLVRWGRTVMHLGDAGGKQVLNRASIEYLLKSHHIYPLDETLLTFGPLKGYGMGWMMHSFKGYSLYEHSGSIPGYVTSLGFLLEAELVVAVVSNTENTSLPLRLPFHIADEVLGLPKTADYIGEDTISTTKDLYQVFIEGQLGKGLPPQINNTKHTHDLRAYTGIFHDPNMRDLVIRIEKDPKTQQEHLHFKNRHYEGRLEHYHYDTFRGNLRSFCFDEAFLGTFIVSPAGDVVQFQMAISEPCTFEKRSKLDTEVQ
ncbi:hypothetical protein BGX28_006402 [Mortierella sp. GBA30]|nr:hypothetical protein BGX28_006402 [Mortierella sp. GBA30]